MEVVVKDMREQTTYQYKSSNREARSGDNLEIDKKASRKTGEPDQGFVIKAKRRLSGRKACSSLVFLLNPHIYSIKSYQLYLQNTYKLHLLLSISFSTNLTEVSIIAWASAMPSVTHVNQFLPPDKPCSLQQLG